MTDPLTPEVLDAIQQRTNAHGRGIYGYVINDIEYQGNWVHDIHRLLAEVDRLRAERDALAARLDAVWDIVRDSQAEQTVLDAAEALITRALDGSEDR